jgi:hypothetical protein
MLYCEITCSCEGTWGYHNYVSEDSGLRGCYVASTGEYLSDVSEYRSVWILRGKRPWTEGEDHAILQKVGKCRWTGVTS